MGLEDLLYGSKIIRDYLKLFSEQQWNRVSKATIMLGIQYLVKLTNNDLRKLSVHDIEDIVVQLASGQISIPPVNEKPLGDGKRDKKKKKSKRGLESSHTESYASSINKESEDIVPVQVPSSRQPDSKKSAQPAKTNEVLDVAVKAPKPPSTWRRGDSKEPMEINYLTSAQKPRASSLNPLIYPPWWGEDSDFEKTVQRRDRSAAPVTGGRKKDQTVNVRRVKEDTLDQRVKQAKKNQSQSPPPPTQTYYHQQHQYRQDASPSYAYTSNKNAPKYSPLRNMQPGANNVPMSYAGPPTQAERNRNKGRPTDDSQVYDRVTGYGNTENLRNEEDRMIGGGFGPRGDKSRQTAGGVVMSYSPPRDKTKNPKKGKDSKKQKVYNDTIGSRNTRINNYTGGYQHPHTTTNATSQGKYKHVQSKVRSQVEFHKRQHKEQQQREGTTSHSKEPQIYFKGSYPPHGMYDMTTSNPLVRTGGPSGTAALRRRSPTKEYYQQQQSRHPIQQYQAHEVISEQDQFSLKNTQGQWPSSIENLNMSNNRSTGQNFYPYQAPRGYQGDMPRQPNQGRNTNGFEGTLGSNGISGSNITQTQHGDITRGQINSPISSHVSESSPEKQQIPMAKPDRKSRKGQPSRPVSAYQGGPHGQATANNTTLEPSILKARGIPYNGNESKDEVLYKSDGFEQSRYYPNHQQPYNNSSRHQQQTYNHRQQPPTNIHYPGQSMGTGELSSSQSQLHPHVDSADNTQFYHGGQNPNNLTRASNPFTKNQQPGNMSYLSYGYRQTGSNFDKPSGRRPTEQQWVGEYIMDDAKQRNLHELAQANSYTYTLNNPMNQRSAGSQQQYSNNDSEEESDLSNYSPNEQVRGYFQGQQMPVPQGYNQNNGPYEYRPNAGAVPVDESNRRNLNIDENESQDEDSFSDDEGQEGTSSDDGEDSESYDDGSDISSSSYGQAPPNSKYPATAASGFYPQQQQQYYGGRQNGQYEQQMRTYGGAVHNQTHHY